MQIDWLTVGAQIVNFLVLVWLLQHFLYGPVTRAMARREERIEARLDEAERSRAEAETEAQAYREQQQAFEERRAGLLAEARDAAETERRTLEQEAREAVETRRREWLGQLDAQRGGFLRDLRRRSAEEFFALARRALGDLANADLQEQIALSFLEQLDALDDKTWEGLAGRSREAEVTVAVRSRFALPAEVERQVTTALRNKLGADTKVAYEVDDALSCGMELRSGSRTIAWSLGSYLEGLEKAVDDQVAVALAGQRG